MPEIVMLETEKGLMEAPELSWRYALRHAEKQHRYAMLRIVYFTAAPIIATMAMLLVAVAE